MSETTVMSSIPREWSSLHMESEPDLSSEEDEGSDLASNFDIEGGKIEKKVTMWILMESKQSG